MIDFQVLLAVVLIKLCNKRNVITNKFNLVRELLCEISPHLKRGRCTHDAAMVFE